MIITKHKLLKKVSIIALSATMLTGMVLVANDSIHKKSVVTEAGTTYDGEFTNSGRTYRYKISGSEMTLVSVSGGSGNMSIPSSVSVNGKTYTVTALGDWFGFWIIVIKIVIIWIKLIVYDIKIFIF